MSVTDPNRAKRKARQAQRFANYSMKKTLSREELEHAHIQALEENAKRDLMAFGAKLKGYSDRSGGIDKSYFENIAKKAMAGIMPGAKDIEGDTDPRDFVLDMMNRTFPKQIMKQYKGLSPSFDNYLNMNYDIHDEAYDMKIPPYANRKTAQAEKKEREKKQRERAGLDEAEYVALMGSYTLGFASDDNNGKKGRWTMNPYVFDNTYFQEVLMGSDSRYLKTEADLKLIQNPELKVWVEKYAEDQNLFFENYAKAHVKISERGQEEHLLSEFDNDNVVDGGYQEDGGEHWTLKGNKKGIFGGI